jgi:hypothetical protein
MISSLLAVKTAASSVATVDETGRAVHQLASPATINQSGYTAQLN